MNTLNKNISVALEASAGTGKTFQLSMRTAAMLISGVLPQDILCLTFTKKANNEMLERIITVLDKAAEGKLSDNEKIMLKEETKDGRNKEYSEDEFMTAAKKARDRVFANFSSLKVKTIDAFLNMIMELFPFEAELRPDYKIINPGSPEDNSITDEAFFITMNELINSETWKNILKKLPDTLGISSINIYSLIKKYALFSSSRYIEMKEKMEEAINSIQAIEKKIDNILNLKQKIKEYKNIFIGEFDEKILNGLQIRTYDKLKNSSDVGEISESVLMRLEDLSYSGAFKKYNFSEKQLEYHKKIRNLISDYLKIKGDIAIQISLVVGNILYHNIKKIKNTQNIISFSDMNERAYEMLVTDKPHINKDYLYFRLDGKLNHILIDEFQDTSNIQWMVIRPLAEEAMAGIGQDDKSGSFFYVGDPKQSLYRFRGGSSSLFKIVADTYKGKINKYTLDTNYRSDKNIVDFVNIVFNEAAKMYPNNDLEMFKINQHPRPEHGEGFVNAVFLNDGEDYVQFALRQVQEAKKNGWKYKDIAILVPDNDNGTEIKYLLASEKIPIRLESSRRLVDTGIFSVISALALFIETEDNFSFLEYVFTENHIFAGNEYSDVNFRKKIMKSIKIAAGYQNLTIFERLFNALKFCGLQERFENEPDFVQILDIIALEAPNEKNIRIFLDKITKAASNCSSVTSKDNDAVTIMTIHKSKGLQFPLVILPLLDMELETSLVKNGPFIMNYDNKEGYSISYVHSKKLEPFMTEEMTQARTAEDKLVLEDSLNRLYVAMTRAEKALIIGIKQAKKAKKEIKPTPKNIEELLPLLINIQYKQGCLAYDLQEEKVNLKKEKEIIKLKETEITEHKIKLPTKNTFNFKAAIIGTAFHKAAFLLNGFTEEKAELAAEKAFSYDGACLDEEDKKTIIKYIKYLALSEEWKNLFNGMVFRERKVGMNDSLYSIDFYSVFEDKIILIDYKTGEITKNEKDNYIKQLSKYEEILKNIYGLSVLKYIYHFTEEGLNITQY